MSSAILTERQPVGGGLVRVRLSPVPELSTTHVRHGQYVELRHAGEGPSDSELTIPAAIRGYFAIASAPGEPTWEVLVREGGSMSERLRSLPLGATVLASEARGHGFPVESAHERPLLIAATGSGIAAVLSTIAARIEDGDAARTYVLYGVRARAELALEAELEAMRAAGLAVAVCLSREPLDAPGFHRGYVQDVARVQGWWVAGGLAFVAGHEAMIHGMRQAASSLGLRPEDVRANT